MGPNLEQQAVLRSVLPPGALLARLRSEVAPLDGSFTLVSKLSGGGIVTRALRAPETERPFFGKVGPEEFTIAVIPRGVDVSPYQPILRGRVAGAEEGSVVALTLAPHPGARPLVGVHAVGALLLVGAAVSMLATRPDVAAVGFVFAVVLAGFPWLRARHGFGGDCARSVARLREVLDLSEGSA